MKKIICRHVNKVKPYRRRNMGIAFALATIAHSCPSLGADDEGNKAEEPNNLSPKLEEVLVTGSRLRRSGYDTPAPISVIGEEEMEASGFNNVYDVLKYTPSLGIGLGSSNSNFSADAGASFANLRGLGANRTLVLVNGRRRVSGSSESSAVDLTTIPAAMIDRVETITGGASAVYGADAVTGVVNVILKEDFEGVEISLGGGQSADGDGGERFSADLLMGSKFDNDKGSVTLAFSYAKEEPLMGSERDFSELPIFAFTNPENTGPNDGIYDNIHYDDNRFSNTHYGGTFRVNDVHYTVDPNLRTVQNGSPLLFGFLAYNGGDGFDGADFSQLRIEQETRSTLLNMDYQISNNVNLFVEYGFTSTLATDRTQPSFDFALPLFRENPLLPLDVQELMDAEGVTELAVGRTNVDLGVVTNKRDRKTWTFVAGLEGEFGDGWAWNTSYQYGEYTSNDREENARVNSRFLNAIDAISDPSTGDVVCRSEAARAEGCVPLSILGRNQATAEAKDYVNVTALRSLENTQEVYAALLTGEVFDLPAGPIQVAAGMEYREEGLNFSDDPLAQTGELEPITVGVPNVDVEFDVAEVFIEGLIPLVNDQPFIDELSVEAAIRYSDYSTIGGTTAWKFGANWALNDQIRLRYTQSESVRAPNLTELFAPGVQTNLFIPDPCDASTINSGAPTREANCRALGAPEGYEDLQLSTVPVVTGGNAELTEETSESWTAGVVFTPAFIEGFSLSVDYWSIDIEDAVSTVEVSQVLNRCVDSATIDNAFCPLVTRDPVGFEVSKVNLQSINIGSLTASGVDIQAQYFLDFAKGRLGFNLNSTYLNENEELIDASDPSSLDVRVGEISDPEWRTVLTTSYSRDAWDLRLTTRYVGEAKVDVGISDEALDRNDVSSRIYIDVNAGFDIADNFRISGGINNLTQEDPPKVVGSDLLNPVFIGANGHYENLGRYYHVTAKYRF
jgi:iron complex outermembrane receptor protein